MKHRPYKIFIKDIAKAIDKIGRYIGSLSYGDFIENEMLVDAVLRNLEVIGEAATKVPKEVQQKYPNVPWRRMIGLRNIVIHEYFGVDLSIIWEIVTKNLPETRPAIAQILEKYLEERDG